jgi:outer membrane lipase/esterase
MKNQFRRAAAAFAFGLAALGVVPAQAGYTSLTVFGDSLSDTGNIFLSTGGAIPAAPYFSGRFSDGPIWIDTLAGGLGLPAGAVPALLPGAGGANYAFGGARTGTASSPPGLLAQYGGLWLPANPGGADPNGLYVVVGGGNDMRDARSAFTGTSSADQAGRQSAAAAAANNIFNLVAALASTGARHVLISTLPDLGTTPEAALLGLTAASSDATARYNLLVKGIEAVAEAAFSGLDVITFDMAAIAAAVRNDALNNGGAVFGITNATMPCGTFIGSTGISCAVSVFSDALHPSSALHKIIGAAALQAVPAPGTLALAAVSLLLLAGVASRRRLPGLSR